jgi:hypothetical protein
MYRLTSISNSPLGLVIPPAGFGLEVKGYCIFKRLFTDFSTTFPVILIFGQLQLVEKN